MRALGVLSLVAMVGTANAVLAQAPATVEIELRLSAAEPQESAEVPASVLLRRIQQEDQEHSTEASVSVPGNAKIQAAVGETVEIRVEAPGFWAPAQIVHVVEASTRVAFELRPTSTVTGSVRAPRDHPLPENLEIRFESAPDAANPLNGEHSKVCPLTEAELRCEIPAGRLDLHLRAAGFISIHRWDADLEPRGEHRIGDLELRPGSSVIGRIEATGDDFDPQAVEVELVPRRAGIALDDARRPGALHRRTRANRRGFYELTEIPPGSYTLIARHPGYAPARLEPVGVQEGVESELRTLELERPRSLEAHLSPSRDPFGKPWRVRLLQPGGLPNQWTDAGEGRTDEEGVVRISELSPALHRLQVQDRRGAVWHREEIELVESTTWVDIELPFERLEARVTLDGEPLQARVIFRGIEEGKTLAKDSDEEGKVYVFLPVRKEPWTVDVESSAPKIRARVEGVRVEKRDGEPWAKAEIEVPDTRLYGIVVDEEGRPLPGALVSVRGPEQWSREQVEAAGTNAQFELRGYPPGLWDLEASYRNPTDGTSYSAPLTEVLVTEDVPTGPLRLVARREQVLHGQVVSPEGIGIPGTLVVVGLEQPELLTRNIQHRAAGLDGAFTLRLPTGVPAVQLQVFPPGFTAHQVRVSLPRDEPLVLRPQAEGGGLLIVRWADEEQAHEPLKSRVVLFGDFVYYNPFLDLWAGMHEMASEDRLVVPNLEPGLYTACWDLEGTALDTGRLPVNRGARCVSGQLSPWGELVLEIPASEASSG